MVGSFNQSTRNSCSVSIMAISFKGFRVVGMIVGLCLFPLSLCCHMIEEVIWRIRFLSGNKVAKYMAITQQFFFKYLDLKLYSHHAIFVKVFQIVRNFLSFDVVTVLADTSIRTKSRKTHWDIF